MDNNQTIGAKILALRKARGYTQADLGAYLNISYQAVSKWERDESCPDFNTLSRIAQFFNIPITYFEQHGETAIAQTVPQVDKETEEVRAMLGVCKDCGKVVYEGDEWLTQPQIICKPCHERRKRIEAAKAAEAKRQEERKRQEAVARQKAKQFLIKEKRNKGLIWGTVVSGLIAMIFFLGAFGAGFGGFIKTMGSALLFLAFVFPFVTQLFWDGAVADCALMGGKVIGTPGVIFTFDLDGFIFLIAIKLLFAVLRFIIYMGSLLFFVVIAILISPFTFLPALRRVNAGQFD